MKSYLVSLCVGLIVGLFYSLLGVRSPAPPVVALIGLLGMLIGGQVGSTAMRWISGANGPAAGPTATRGKDMP